ncbi:MAG: SDR family NAD(P)-dependent oxidoreductase [Acidobacteria bacterium]|nr:MAG: SDR family NAD(P)-dependent oxidoreductase [Acidobacteriota bacterium]REK00243.1 MAG: SDR family NAD(P)-dependent oxidoreductase [Acidobacteriota bacterium]
MNSDLEGRSILVTGASGGIGQRLVEVLVEEGAHCFLHYNRGSGAAARLVARLERRHPFARLAGGGADLCDEAAIDALFEAFAEWSPQPFGLVVNAGIWPRDDVAITDMDLHRWRRTIEVNLTGAFLCCRAFLRLLARRAETDGGGGDASIVLIGSTAALHGEADHADYAASKAALHGLMLSLKNEMVRVTPAGRVNLVHPGWVRTPMAEATLAEPGVVERVTATMALRKVATPDDVAAAVCFLLSPRLAGHLTGVALPVSGGMEGRLLHPGGLTADGGS